MNRAKNLSYYLALSFTVQIRKDEDGDYVAGIAELPGCLAHGSTIAEASARLLEVQTLWIEDALANGREIPEPEEEILPSGRWVQRVPRSLHRDLTKLAVKENVSLNQLVTKLLAEAVAVSSPIKKNVKTSSGIGPQSVLSEPKSEWIYESPSAKRPTVRRTR